MKESTATLEPPRALVQGGVLDRQLRHIVLHQFGQLRLGHLDIEDGHERHSFGQASGDTDLHATLRVLDPHAYRRVALRGVVGAGEGYMAGEWTSDNLCDVVRVLARNGHVDRSLDRGSAQVGSALLRLLHLFRRNTRRGSRANISAHYDLGNDFYRLFLDPTMMYSCALFEREDDTLEAASIAKIDRICRKLQLKPDDHVLEIGTGWGSFALHAARHYGCRITTTTISEQQYLYAAERVREAGLSDRITLLRQDYRDLNGQYDKLVSIEMIEAVGHQYLDTFFARCAQLLRPDGVMLLQAITIAEQNYRHALKGVDFIQTYIFPGGFLPSVEALSSAMTRASDLRTYHLEDIGLHYAKTLAHWRQRFMHNREAVRALGYDEVFLRMWEFYLCYCEGGFRERSIGTVQMLLGKPHYRQQPPLGTL